MIPEEKQLLLKDLSARLPYGVVIQCSDNDTTNYKCFLTTDILHEIQNGYEYYNYKPYLRPMSSMTEKEGVEWRELLATYPLCAEFNTDNRGWLIAHSDFILSHHFDIWNLIDKGLALEAPEGMYKTE